MRYVEAPVGAAAHVMVTVTVTEMAHDDDGDMQRTQPTSGGARIASALVP